MEYSEENERLKDQTKCADVRAQLKMCLLKSDCCKVVSYSSRLLFLSRIVFIVHIFQNLKAL